MSMGMNPSRGNDFLPSRCTAMVRLALLPTLRAVGLKIWGWSGYQAQTNPVRAELASEGAFSGASLRRSRWPLTSDPVTDGLRGLAVLHSGNEMQRDALLLIHADDFNTGYSMKVSLIQPGRLFFLCLCHSRVVRCDFIES